MATFVLGKNVKNFTINYDLAKYLTTLTIITDFAENIWNSRVAMKQSENHISGTTFWRKVFFREKVSING